MIFIINNNCSQTNGKVFRNTEECSQEDTYMAVELRSRCC